jgi:WD40 repeat protein
VTLNDTDNKYITFLGKDGYIMLVSNLTKQWVANLKMNGQVRAVSFSPDGQYLYSSGSKHFINSECLISDFDSVFIDILNG